MRLVAATRVLNESDIIEAFIRHTAYYVDHHILIDNGSVDGTVEILHDLRREGFGITVYQSKSCSFVESHTSTLMYRQAVLDHKADWIIFLDADEFIDDRHLGRTLRERLSGLALQTDPPPSLKIRLRDYHVTPEDPQDAIVPRRMTQCTPATDNLKIIVRGNLLNRAILIQPGSHSAHIDGDTECPWVLEPSMYHAHYPARSSYQWLSKSIIGWSKIIASGPEMVRSGHSVHYRDPYEYLRTDARAILRNSSLMEPRSRSDLMHDPILYRGGDLKYTGTTDYAMRAVQVIMQYLNDLAIQHGAMLETINKLGGLVFHTEGEVTRIL
jgi:hypothetical protein